MPSSTDGATGRLLELVAVGGWVEEAEEENMANEAALDGGRGAQGGQRVEGAVEWRGKMGYGGRVRKGERGSARR